MKKLLFLAISLAWVAAGCCQKPCDSCCQEENAVISTIMARRSVRAYLDTPVEREKLQTIAECGINAPNAMNRQAWAVRIVDNPEFITGATELFKASHAEAVARDPNFKNMFRNAPAVIAIAAPEIGLAGFDCGLMTENMMLAACSLGLGTCCLGGPVSFFYEEAAAPFLARLDLPEGYRIQVFLAVGYPDESPDARPRDASKIRFID